jgi:hypothetical protein
MVAEGRRGGCSCAFRRDADGGVLADAGISRVHRQAAVEYAALLEEAGVDGEIH